MRTVELRSAAARAPAFADGRPSLSVCAASFRRIVLCLRISRHTLPCEKISSRPNQGSELAHSNKFRRSSRKCNTPLPLTLCPPPSPCVSRSEEHTSELQSLMLISYAVFCLKKKNKSKRKNTT